MSYAFNRPERVAAPTRERVLQTAAALGYAGPDATARALRRGRPDALALVGGSGVANLLGDPAGLEVARGVARTCDRLGLQLTLERLAGGPAVIFRGARLDSPGSGVVVDPPEDFDGVSVRADVASGAAAAARYLADLGHRRLVVIAWQGCGGRLAGARAGWGDTGPLDVVVAPGPQRLDGEPSGRAALAVSSRPTAILALSDALAFETLDAAARRGLRVPADLSVVGIDDLPGSAAYGLTSVLVPYRPLGELAGEALWSLIDGRPVAVLPPLPTELVVRTSTGSPRTG